MDLSDFIDLFHTHYEIAYGDLCTFSNDILEEMMDILGDDYTPDALEAALEEVGIEDIDPDFINDFCTALRDENPTVYDRLNLQKTSCLL